MLQHGRDLKTLSQVKPAVIKSQTLYDPTYMKGFPGGSDGKEGTRNAGDSGLILGLGRSSGGGNGNPLQYSSLNNPLDRRGQNV